MKTLKRWRMTLLAVAAVVLGCTATQDGPPQDSPPKKEAPPKIVETDKEPDIHFVATPQDVVDMMLHLARVKESDLVLDLGCGDGRIVVTAAKRYGSKARGYDIDPERVKESWENVKKNKVDHLVRIEQKDIFTLDLSQASVVTLYLLPELNVRLIPQLEKLKPGSRIVSHEFDMEGVEPDMVVRMRSKEDDCDHEIYLWTTPLRKEAKEDVEEEDGEDETESPKKETSERKPAEEKEKGAGRGGNDRPRKED